MKYALRHNLDTTHVAMGWLIAAAVLVVLLCSTPAAGLTRIRDIARPWGERVNRLHCIGLVVGLNGTGDSDKSMITRRPMREYLLKTGNPADVDELKGIKNTALVQVTAEIGRNGAREGDRIDVRVSSMGDAKDLSGGTLMMCFLISSNVDDDRVYAIAQGPVSIPTAANKRVGLVKNGADIEADVFYNYVHYDESYGPLFTLIIDEYQANFQTSKYLAMIIDQELSSPDDEMMGARREAMAVAVDPRNVLVRIPQSRASRPASFIADIMNIIVDLPDPEAMVVINERTGTIAITGNVEIAPVSVCVDGLVIRVVEPEPQPLPGAPVMRETNWLHFGQAGARGTKIEELIETLDLLNVPVQQKINAIREINRAGVLRATLVNE